MLCADICSERARRRVKHTDSSIKLLASNANYISLFHIVNILDGKDGKHYKILCSKCYTRQQAKNSAQSSYFIRSIRTGSETFYMEWLWFSTAHCSSVFNLQTFWTTSKGGRPFNTKLGPPRKKEEKSIPSALKSHYFTEISPVNSDSDSTLQK